jgi:transcriptional regulator with XRE-family HTH domain
MGMGKRESTISDELREYVEASGRSQFKLAQEAGVYPSAICRFVKGERLLDLSSVDKLAKVLGLRLVQRKTR